jgi:hypothetical protein
MAKVRGGITPPAKGQRARRGGTPAPRKPAPGARRDVGPSPHSTQPSAAPGLAPLAAKPRGVPRVAIASDKGPRQGNPTKQGPRQESPQKQTEAQKQPSRGLLMELHWGDTPPPPSSRKEGLVQRWVKRGDALLRHLAEHGAARHEYRADLKEGRFVWVSPEGRVSAEAEAQVICSYATTTSVIAMGWADPLIRSAAIPRLDGMASELDNIDEEAAWRVAMQAAELSRAEYLYRVQTPHAWYFLALRKLTFTPGRVSFTPGTPVGLVLRSLVETRQAIESRAEPTEVVRARLTGVGRALLKEAAYAYRGTDWVARLERTGRCLKNLAERLPRESYHSVAAGRHVEEWLDREAIIELSQALTLLEDEWALFT